MTEGEYIRYSVKAFYRNLGISSPGGEAPIYVLDLSHYDQGRVRYSVKALY